MHACMGGRNVGLDLHYIVYLNRSGLKKKVMHLPKVCTVYCMYIHVHTYVHTTTGLYFISRALTSLCKSETESQSLFAEFGLSASSSSNPFPFHSI